MKENKSMPHLKIYGRALKLYKFDDGDAPPLIAHIAPFYA
jgi:hypothetical protein